MKTTIEFDDDATLKELSLMFTDSSHELISYDNGHAKVVRRKAKLLDFNSTDSFASHFTRLTGHTL